MNFNLQRTLNPDIEPLTLAELKAQLRCYSSTTEDSMITSLGVAGRLWVEALTGRALIDQTWRLNLGPDLSPPLNQSNNTDSVAGPVWGSNPFWGTMQFGPRGIYLRRSPILAISAISEVDSDGGISSLTLSDYALLDEKSKYPRLLGLSESLNYQITFRAGYAERTLSPQTGAETVPDTLKNAILLWVDAMYSRDEKMTPILLKCAEDLAVVEKCELGMA